MSDFALTKKGAVKYSPGEQRIFQLLPKDGKPRTSLAIAKSYYGTTLPFHGRKIVIGLLSSLMRKADINSELFRICKTKRSGPIPMAFWIESRNGKMKKAA